MVRRIFLVALTIIFLIGVSGCMMDKKTESPRTDKPQYTPEMKKEKVLAYLKNKYNEEFVPVSMNESGWGQGYDEIILYAKNGKKEDTFTVRGTIKDDGSYAMHDGYFKHIINDEYEAAMSGFVNEIYKEFKLYTSFGEGVLPDQLNKNTKLEEIYSIDPDISTDTIVFVKKASSEGIDTAESLKKIAEKMKVKRLVGQVTIYIVYDDKFEKTSLATLNEPNIKEFIIGNIGRYIDVYNNLEISEVN